MDSIQKRNTPGARGSRHTIDLRSKVSDQGKRPDEKEERVSAWFGARSPRQSNAELISPADRVAPSLSAAPVFAPGRESSEKEDEISPVPKPSFSAGARLAAWRQAVRPKAPMKRRFLLAVLGGIGIAAVFFLMLVSTTFARLTIAVTPKEQAVSFENIALLLDASLAQPDYEKRTVPVQAFEFSREKTEEFSATGKANVRESAAGKVRIYNAFGSAPQTLVARTRFVTEKGILFRLPATITVPGAKIENGKIVPQFVEAELRADAPGEQANISGEVRLGIPGFQGSPKYDGFYAVAPSGFQGGALGERPVAKKEDIAAGQERVTKAAYDEVRVEMAQQIPSSFLVLPALQEVEILDVRAPKAGSPAERFSVSARAEGRTLVFQKDAAADVIARTLQKDHLEEELLSSSAEVEYQVREVDFGKRRAALIARGTMRARRTFSPEELAQLLAGKKEGSVIEAMKLRDEFSKFRLAFFPPWRFRAPADPGKIRFEAE